MKLGIFGQQGAGKTFLGMLLARSFQQQHPEIILYTNVNCTGQGIKVIKDFGEIPLERDTPKILLIDEAMFTLDSRGSSSKQNVTFTKFFALLRKLNFVMTIFCTHRYGLLDVRVREQLDYVISGRRSSDVFEYLCIDVTTGAEDYFIVPKHKTVFDFANYDTLDFPNPITTYGLQNNPLFTNLK